MSKLSKIPKQLIHLNFKYKLMILTAFYLIQTALAGKLIEFTQENFKVNPTVDTLVVFIPQSYCKYSPHVEQVVQGLSEGGILGAGEKDPKLILTRVTSAFAQQLSIQALPATRLYMQGEYVDYIGDYSDLKEWVSYKVKQSLYNYGDARQLAKFISDKPVVLLYHNKNVSSPWQDPLINVLKQVANLAFERERRNFKVVHSHSVREAYTLRTDAQIVLLKNNATELIEYEGPLTKQGIYDFLMRHFHPTIMDFDKIAVDWVFNENTHKLPILFFVSENDFTNNQYQTLEQAIRNYKTRFRMVKICQKNKKYYKRVLNFLGLEHIHQNQPPEPGLYDKLMSYIREVTLDGIQVVVYNATRRYKLQGETTTTKIIELLENVLKGRADRHYKCTNYNSSEKLKTSCSDLPAQLNNFNQNILLYFYTEWCSACDLQLIQSVTKGYDVKVIYIDGDENELANHDIRVYPTIKLRLQDSKRFMDFPDEEDINDDSLNAFLKVTKQQSDL